MNFFKKALVASAVVASFGAAADATVSSTALELSQEGIAGGLSATLQGLTFDVVVGTDTPASSKITLTFDSNIDLTAGLLGGSVDNTIGSGQGIVNNGGAGDITFDYGTGSFTFDNVVVDDNDQTKGEKDSITFQVNLGNSLTAGSAFRVTLGVPAAGGTAASGLTTIAGAANLAYQSTNADGSVVIEDGAGAVSKEVAQFGIAVTTPLDSLIDRDVTSKFTNVTSTAVNGTDTLVLTYTNKQNLAAALLNTDVVATLKGNFSGLADAEFGTVTAAVAPATIASPAGTAAVAVSGTVGAEDTLTLTLPAADTALDGSTLVTVTYTATGSKVLPATGEIKAKIVATNTNGDPLALTLAENVVAGEWAIDATIINVPYFPVGYDGVTSTIQLANEGTADVDIIVTANDQDGNQYGPVNLDTLAGDFADGLAKDAVTKLSAMQVMTLLDAPAESNLSITFNVDANEGVVNGYAFTQKPGTGRTEISTSQQRGN